MRWVLPSPVPPCAAPLAARRTRATALSMSKGLATDSKCATLVGGHRAAEIECAVMTITGAPDVHRG